jgi:hypothetical protein
MFRLLLATAMSLTPLASSAQGLVPPSEIFSKEFLSPVLVTIRDSATGACWTNLGEVQTYFEDQLELVGYEVTRDRSAINVGIVQVSVSAQRLNQGTCVGHVIVLLASPVQVPGSDSYTMGVIDYLSRHQIGDTLNITAIDLVQTFIQDRLASYPETRP